MELTVNRANGRREERVPLDVLVELGSDEGDEMLEADGLDLSPHGMAMRASFVPPVGAPLRCQFRCPPAGDPVRVEGEVVWSEWTGPRVGAFGMRFSALDTKSATAIRHYIEPAMDVPEPEPEPQRVATLRIDGLGAPIEADVRLADAGRVVLEQELGFLKLGRGVEVDVPGRGKQRGRIGSVELRQSHLDVPTLVFGILLDEAARSVEVALPVSALLTTPMKEAAEEPAFVPELEAAREVSEPIVDSEPSSDTWPERPVFAAAAPEPSAEPGLATPVVEAAAVEAAWVEAAVASAVEPPVEVVRAKVAKRKREESSEARRAATPRVTPAMLASASALTAWFVRVRALFAPLLAALQERTGEAKSPLPALKAQCTALVASVKTWFAGQLARVRAARTKRAEQQRQRAQAPQPRVQRVQGGAQVSEPVKKPRPAVQASPKQRRLIAVGLALSGVSLGVYALAPRSGADRIRTPRESARPQPVLTVQAEPVVAAPVTAPVAGAPLAAPVQPEATPTEALSPKVFGFPEVPNGRSFVLRMSGPVEDVEGDQREDGFTVRVPGRLALDRASPIATSHRAVARAMILNRGDYAELTVDFLPGMRPKYQVIGKDNTIEVTLERQ